MKKFIYEMVILYSTGEIFTCVTYKKRIPMRYKKSISGGTVVKVVYKTIKKPSDMYDSEHKNRMEGKIKWARTCRKWIRENCR